MEKLRQIWKTQDLRNSILFVLGMLVVFRLASHLPIPGVDTVALRNFFQSNQALGLLNLFTGGGLQNFSVVMMSVGPYITASIIMQLLTMIVPKLEALNKEEQGRQTINRWTRWITVPLALIQGYGMISLLRGSTYGILTDITTFDYIAILITMTAGTIFMMWIGELISEKKIGNGISILIFAGIVSGLPQVFSQFIFTFDQAMLFNVVGFAVIALLTVVGVVIINEGQRNIPVQYARQVRGNRAFGGTSTHLPLRVNMAGVIPIIFAISVVVFPPMIAQFFAQADSQFIASVARFIINLFNNQIFYAIFYFILVFAFTFFYAEVIFHPTQIAENLQKQGGFIPGIRPGRHTSEYLANIAHRIILFGAIFLGIIAILPLIMRYFTGINSLAIGGTSLLIVVSVVIEMVKQIEAQLTMRQYDKIIE